MLEGLLFWIGYLAWLGLFAWIGWRKLKKILGISAVILLSLFAVLYAFAMQGADKPGWNEGGSFAAGMMVGFAAFVLVAPVLLGAMSFLLSKLWDRV